MLHAHNTQIDSYGPAEEGSPLELIDFVLGIVRQQFVVILSITLLGIGLGALYLYLTPPVYTARATMIIDRGKVQAQLGGMSREVPVDAVEVDSQIQLIKSETVTLAVIRKLNLDEDPEFVGPPLELAGLIHKLGSKVLSKLLSRDHPTSAPDLVRAALVGVTSRLTVNRVGGYVIEIEFQSLKPERAVQIANAFADSYIKDQLNSRYLAARQAAGWLQDRIQELGDQSSRADEKVVRFKTKHNIVAAGGRSLNEQQVAELSTQLGLAREKTSTARARLDRIEAIIRADSPEKQIAGTVSDTLNNPVIVKLRSQYLELANREADWSRRFGMDHLAVINLRRQIREIRGSIADELGRIAETYKSDYEIAKQRQIDVEETIAKAVLQSQKANQAQIELRQLESAAETYRSLYTTAVKRNTELVQQQSFPGTEARVITPATPTGSRPKPLLVLFMSATGGMMLGFGLGILRGSLERAFRTSGQVETVLRTNCLGLAPLLVERTKPKGSAPRSGPRTIVRNTSVSWEVVDRPLSRFAEVMRSIKSAADLSGSEKSAKVLGFTSSLPNEGKSTICAAYALLAAQAGARVILVDCDLRHPTLSATLAAGAEHGILDVILGKKLLEEVLWTDATTNLSFLPGPMKWPGPMKSRMAHSAEILASDAMRTLFGELRKKYDCVVVDFPPVAPIVDVRSTAGLVDWYVLIVEWARTKVKVAELALGKAPIVRDNLLGVVLNKVNFKILRRYEGDRRDYYSDKYIAKYGDDRAA